MGQASGYIKRYVTKGLVVGISVTLGNFLKPLATIYLPKSPTFLGNFWRGVNIYHLGNFYRHLAIFSGHTGVDSGAGE